jgi:pimeloyl-ACP methyl ester carboxylesterase
MRPAALRCYRGCVSSRAEELHHQFQLVDGRTLAFRKIGEPDGIPVLYLHGSPSASSEWKLFGPAERIAAHGLQFIAPDRPGSGGSRYQRGRRILDWPSDATELMDRLGIGTFAVLGYSGGGPYALACALRLPKRLECLLGCEPALSHGVPSSLPGVWASG